MPAYLDLVFQRTGKLRMDRPAGVQPADDRVRQTSASVRGVDAHLSGRVERCRPDARWVSARYAVSLRDLRARSDRARIGNSCIHAFSGTTPRVGDAGHAATPCPGKPPRLTVN